ncbi:hypothetical protein O3G_MSEX003770 [Manduca sexta]|uniref:BPTI/Kunitz inhibitor domain-containing protein n=1 Tax=Manduca sexta TaxID=7130 RepID=A0A922CGY9_MANSE|nr:hypothetical protein O3G_MSEX003770 [Manduca sexta]KAG6445188.1 hypothetical protein O3G_MSEX003770 [Manduca sexta]
MKLLYFFTLLCCINICLSVKKYYSRPRPQYEIAENDVDTENICLLPFKIGECRAHFYRYGYDPEIKACRVFVYGGCRGNANNFKTLEECQKACEA